jgi:hypothetical protein
LASDEGELKKEGIVEWSLQVWLVNKVCTGSRSVFERCISYSVASRYSVFHQVAGADFDAFFWKERKHPCFSYDMIRLFFFFKEKILFITILVQHLRSLRTLASELREFVEEQKLPRKMLPSAFQLQTLGRSDLHQAILRHGGYADVAHKMRWRPHRRRRGAWSDIGSVVKDVLRFAAEAATQRGESEESARMPTHEELRSAGRHDLRHALQRHGSTKVAELAGLPMSRRGGAKGAQVLVQSLLAEDGERSGGGEVATGDHVGHGK